MFWGSALLRPLGSRKTVGGAASLSSVQSSFPALGGGAVPSFGLEMKIHPKCVMIWNDSFLQPHQG